ncbi:MAG: GNAT family N-acetyltransferase [Qipengyuania sp.]
MDRQPSLETKRLAIRPLQESDREALFAVASDPALWEQHPMHDRWRRDVFDAFFAEALRSGGAVVAIEKAANAIIGSSRYDRYRPDEGGAIEIGWTFLARKYWGKGHNHEMKRAMLEHAFGQVALVEFRVGQTNYRSRKALENIGARMTDRTELGKYDGKRVLHLVYEMTRDDFDSGPLGA